MVAWLVGSGGRKSLDAHRGAWICSGDTIRKMKVPGLLMEVGLEDAERTHTENWIVPAKSTDCRLLSNFKDPGKRDQGRGSHLGQMCTALCISKGQATLDVAVQKYQQASNIIGTGDLKINRRPGIRSQWT